MLQLIIPITLFTILIIEIPFVIFINISVERMFLEYIISSPIKTQGYAMMDKGEFIFGRAKKQNQNQKGGNITNDIISRIKVKTLHVRGIFSGDDIPMAIFESVAISNVVGWLQRIAYQNNPYASLSWSQCVAQDEDTNIFVQTTLWLSVFDMLQIAFISGIKKLRQAKNK